MPPNAQSRLLWIDHLRTLVILLVVNMHACVTYSHVGDWYYMADHLPSESEKILFIFWQAHLQSFFMGLLFFVAGYFAWGALARRGAGGFMRERLWRLGAPTLLYMLVIHPFILLGLNPWHADFAPLARWYPHYLLSGKFVGSSGPMWFAFTLLIFSGVEAAARRFQGEKSGGPPLPRPTHLFLFGLTLGLATFLVRLVQPLGTNIINFQIGYFAQYVAAFTVGLAAARGGWLVALAKSSAARWAGWLGLIGGPIALLILFLCLRGVPGAEQQYPGGWNLPALGLAVWEQLTGVALGLGLMSFCARRLSAESPALKWMSDRSFGVYLLHPPVLVGLAMVFRAMPPHPIPQAVLLTISGVLISFLLSDIARRSNLIRRIL